MDRSNIIFANQKEKKCIDYSLQIRKKVAKEEIKKLKRKYLPLFLTPTKYIHYFFSDSTFKGMSVLKLIFVMLVLSILYLLTTPIVFIFRLIEIITGKKSNIKNKIYDIEASYSLGYDVTGNKTFSQLWDDKGLRNWGGGHMHLSGLSNDQQMDCMIYWFEVLYRKDKSEIDILIEQIKQRIKKTIGEFYDEHPNGHVLPMQVHQLLPEEIDKKYGNYDQYEGEAFSELKDDEELVKLSESIKNEYINLPTKYRVQKLLEAKKLLVEFINEYPQFNTDKFIINIGQFWEDEYANSLDFLFIEIIYPKRYRKRLIPKKYNEYRVFMHPRKFYDKYRDNW
ncbi:MAG: hypothetical protein PF485_09455 [Bacteroidales bacterium]|jgi:hypothetical protein|nr:hypothetical protein [Bacteroidales bacterium]